MNVYISSDHGGFKLKNEILQNKTLTEKYSFVDLGPTELNEADDYPDFARRVAEKIQIDKDALGILICRSGNGMCVSANKFKGVYAAVAFSEKHAEMARRDDNVNVLCLDADYDVGDSPLAIIEKFLSSKFEGMDTRHGRRFMKILELEKNFK